MLCALGPTVTQQRGEPREHLWGAFPLQEPGPQAGPWAPCLPANYSERAFGHLTSGVFHEEKHWTFCPRLSREPGQPGHPQECSQSFHVGLYPHSSAPSPLPHLPTERGKVSMLAEVPLPRRQSWPSQVSCPRGGLLGHGSGEGGRLGSLPDSEL